jgi:hypothetical protein
VGGGAVGEDGGGQRRWLPEDGRVAGARHPAAEVGGLSMSSMATSLWRMMTSWRIAAG